MAFAVWFKFSLIFLYYKYGLCVTNENGEEYLAGFSRDVFSCPDFDNDVLDFDGLELTEVEDEEYEGVGLMGISGSMALSENIDEGVILSVDIVKILDSGKDPVFGTSMDICQAIKDKDAPWAEAFEAMNIDGCPISSGPRDVDEIVLDLSFAKDFLNDHYTGDYECTVQLLNEQKQPISCHVLGLSVLEV